MIILSRLFVGLNKIVQVLLFLVISTLPLTFWGTAHAFVFISDNLGNIYSVNTATRVASLIGNSNVGALTDLAVDPSGQLWGIDFNNLYKIDGSTGSATLVGSLGISGFNALAFDATGTLYGAGYISTNLFTINTATGAATLVGPGSMGWVSSGDLAFDSAGRLYLAGKGTLSDQLVRVLPTTGTGILIGSTGISSLYGLAFEGGSLYGYAGPNQYRIDLSTGAAILDGPLSGLAGGAVVYGATAALVPVPAAMYLFGIGLIGFATLTCWKMRRNFNPA